MIEDPDLGKHWAVARVSDRSEAYEFLLKNGQMGMSGSLDDVEKFKHHKDAMRAAIPHYGTRCVFIL